MGFGITYLSLFSSLETLAQAMETAISAEFRVPKASELMKMVSLDRLFVTKFYDLTCEIKYPKYKERPEYQEGIPRSWDRKDGTVLFFVSRVSLWPIASNDLLCSVIRTGIPITSYLQYNSIDAPSSVSSVPFQEDKIPEGVRMYWHCPHCDSTYSFVKRQILEHLTSCGGDIQRGSDQ